MHTHACNRRARACIHAQRLTRTCTRTNVQMRMHKCKVMDTRTQSYTKSHARTHARTLTHMQARTHARVHKHARAHNCTHKHAQSRRKVGAKYADPRMDTTHPRVLVLTASARAAGMRSGTLRVSKQTWLSGAMSGGWSRRTRTPACASAVVRLRERGGFEFACVRVWTLRALAHDRCTCDCCAQVLRGRHRSQYNTFAACRKGPYRCLPLDSFALWSKPSAAHPRVCLLWVCLFHRIHDGSAQAASASPARLAGLLRTVMHRSFANICSPHLYAILSHAIRADPRRRPPLQCRTMPLTACCLCALRSRALVVQLN